MKKYFPVLLFCCLFSLLGYKILANEWVDMGPLNASSQGHVWSKVVDEVGNTQGRNETWQLSLPCPVIAEIIVKCPDSYSLEVSLDYTHDYHGMIQLKPERTAIGFYTKEITFKDPKLIKNLRISVYNRKPSTDQKYQLTVNMKTIDGKPVSATVPTASSSDKDKDKDTGAGEKLVGKTSKTEKGQSAFTQEGSARSTGTAGSSASILGEGVVVALANRAKEGLFIDIDGNTGKLMPLQKYTGFGGCDWVLHDVGEGYFSLKNRHSGKFLDIDGNDLGAVMLADYTNFRGCDWRLEKLENGHYKIINRFWTEKKGTEIVLDIDGKNIPIVAPYTNFGGCDWRVDQK